MSSMTYDMTLPKPNGKEHHDNPPEVHSYNPFEEDSDTMPPRSRDDVSDRLLETMERIDQRLEGNLDSRAKRALYLPIAAAVLISVTPQLFSGVWWTRGTVSDTSNRIDQLERSLAAETKARETDREDLKVEQTWRQSFMIKMAERGYLIDPVTGNISEIHPKGKH